MKRTLTIMFLVLAISTSLIAGTLSMYTVSIDNLAQGNVVAKEFVFVGEGTDSFQQGVKIAPTEKVQWHFSVKNYENTVVTETDLYYRLTFHVGATEGKGAIEPLLVTVNGAEIETVAGVGSLAVEGEFPINENGQEEEYTVEIYWPDGDADIAYAGNSFGTTLKVAAVARQMPFDWEGPEEPEVPEEPEESDIHVLYEVINTWSTGFSYRFTVTNNTSEDINGWELTFFWPNNRITNLDQAIPFSLDEQSEGWYKLSNPTYYLNSISSGGNLSFIGRANGSGGESIENVQLNGKPVELTCVLMD